VRVRARLDRRAGHSTNQGVARYVEKFSPNMITAVLKRSNLGPTVFSRA
jgi:hypothetical protein